MKYMATIKRFEDLEVWQLARNLSQFAFKITSKEKFAKDYKLKDQFRTSTGSAMDNITEGFGREGKNGFVTFLGISNGSVCEAKSQLYRALDYTYITQEKFNEGYEITDLLNNKLGSFMHYLNTSDMKGEKFRNRV
jgi:four helix bundle protein